MPARKKTQGSKKPTKPSSKTRTSSKVTAQQTAFSRMHKKYADTQSKNARSVAFLLTLSIGFIIVVGIFLMNIFSGFNLNLTSILSKTLPQQILGEGLPEGRINALVIGVGGDENDAPDLTDSLIFATFDPRAAENTQDDSLVMVSVPRDLFVDSEYLGVIKINELYARMSRLQGHEKAMQHLVDKVSEIVGKEINFYVKVDFRGFREAVDYIGGIEVDVPERLYDNEFPDGNWGYTTFIVEKGLQQFDGNTALKYVRSRHSTSDFDRSRRQKIVLKALKDRVASTDILTSPRKIEDLWVTFRENFETNFSLGQIIQIADIAQEFNSDRIYGFNINDTCFAGGGLEICEPGGFLYAPQREFFNDQAGFLPNYATTLDIGEYTQISKFVHLVVSFPEFVSDARTVHILNASKIPGMAGSFALKLKSYGFNIPTVGGVANTQVADSSESFLYYDKQSMNADDPTLQALGFLFFGEQLPEILPKESKSGTPKIEIILGLDAPTFAQ